MENIANVLTGKRLYPVFHRIPGTLFLVICLCICPSISTAISIWPTEIKFDYEPGYSNDALNIRLDADQDVRIPEWILYEGSYKCAYIKGQTNLKILVRFDSDTDNTNFLIKATVYTGVGIGSVCEAFVADCELDENDWITLYIAGSVPSSVGIRTFVWKWEATALPMSAPYCPVTCVPVYTQHTYYTLLAEPQEPMAEPWTVALNYACDCASGQTTATGAATEITEFLNTCGFKYETERGASRYYVDPMMFNLEQIITDLESPIGIEVNCLDMAFAVVTFGNALGSGLNLTTFNGFWVDGFPTYPYERYWFPLNYIDPIGSASPTNNTFSSPLIGNDCRTGGFGYHAFAENDNDNVWDATLQYDIDSNPDNVSGSNPGCGNTTTEYYWVLPCNESEATYIERLVDPWTNKTNCSDREDCGWFNDEEFTIYNED